MKRLFFLLGILLSIVLFDSSLLGAAAAPRGMTIRVYTKTCLFIDLQEILGEKGAFVIVGVAALPTPDSPIGVNVGSKLIGDKVTGVTITRQGWNLSIDASRLTFTPRTGGAPWSADALKFILESELEIAFKQAVEKKTVPPGTAVPAISAGGLTSGTARVSDAGSNATPITGNTAEQNKREEERAAAEKAAAARKP